jgi:hypothetical protein
MKIITYGNIKSHIQLKVNINSLQYLLQSNRILML